MGVTCVSVLLPVARVDTFVVPAIRSVLNQYDVEVEVIAIGPDAQSDPDRLVEQHIHHHFAGDSRLRFQSRTAPGIVNALNLARQHANGDYIARMDADDVSEPMRFREQLALANTHETPHLISSQVSIFSECGEVLTGNRQYEGWLNQHTDAQSIRDACFIESPLPHPTWLAHRSVWDNIGDYQAGDFPEDYDMIVRAWLLNIPMAKPKRTLLKWREHKNRLTRTDSRYRREAFTQVKARAVVDPRSKLGLDTGRNVWIAGTGRNARNWHDALDALQTKIAGFVDLDGPNAKLQKRDKPVIRYSDLVKKRGDDLLITAITAPAARNELKRWCDEHGLKTGVDVIFGG